MPIIAAVDQTDRAGLTLREAERLSSAFDEPIHAVHVLTRDDFVSLERTSVNQTGQAVSLDDVRAVAAEIADELLADAGVDGEGVGLVGDPPDEVVEYADAHDADYIVLAGRKRSAVGKAIFGSVTQSVLIESDRPVVSVRGT
jgi:nucleotide-binding universal stress UspA family protein